MRLTVGEWACDSSSNAGISTLPTLQLQLRLRDRPVIGRGTAVKIQSRIQGRGVFPA